MVHTNSGFKRRPIEFAKHSDEFMVLTRVLNQSELYPAEMRRLHPTALSLICAVCLRVEPVREFML
jgi:hypothetical protein